MIWFNLLSILVACIVAFVIDWSIFGRIVNVLPLAFPHLRGQAFRYRDHTGRWRILALLVAAVAACTGVSEEYHSLPLYLLGIALFVAAHIAAYVPIFSKSRSID